MNALRRWIDHLERLPPRAVAAFLTLLGLVLALRLAGLVGLSAVNVPFSDQWALLTRLYNGFQWNDLPAAFFWQHGPHRQGLPFVGVLAAYHLSDWNVRLDSFWIAACQLLAGALALRLRRRLLPVAPQTGSPGGWSVWDAMLLLAFWGVCGFETMVVAPNASHSIFPLLLLMLLLNVWVGAPGVWRTFALGGLLVALGFTGFGLTALPGVGLVLLLQAWRGGSRARRDALALMAVIGLTLAAFLVNYRFVVSAPGFELMRPNPFDYLRFVAAMLSHFVLMVGRNSWWVLYPVGAVFLVAMLGVVAWGVKRLGERPAVGSSPGAMVFWQVVVMLLGCSLAFALLTAYGRVQLGEQAAVASRYTVLTLPAVAALYMVLLRERGRWAWAPVVLLGVLLVFGLRTVPESRLAYRQSMYFADIKRCWLSQYEASRRVDIADQRVLALDALHAYQKGLMGSQAQWAFMERHALGPFAGQGGAPLPLVQDGPSSCQRLLAGL